MFNYIYNLSWKWVWIEFDIKRRNMFNVFLLFKALDELKKKLPSV